MPRRQVDDVAILDWASADGPTLVGELRSLVEAGSKRVLLDLTGFETRADALETLTEVRTVCDDRGCAIGLFGVDDAFQRVVEIMELGEDLPPVLGRAEADALASLRGGAAPGNGQKPAAAPARPAEPEIDIELDQAHAPTAKFDKGEVVSIAFGPRPAAAGAAGGGSGQADDDLLAIDWTPLVQTGYEIGGEHPERIVAMAGGAPATPAARQSDAPTSPLPVQRKAATPAPAPAPITGDDDVIDLDVAPARVPAGRDRAAALRKTEVLPAFDVEAEAARQAAAASEAAWGAPAAAVLGGREEQGGEGFSPVDSGAGGPPAGVLARGPAPAPGRPSAERKSERFAPPGRRPLAAPIPGATPAPAAQPARPAAYAPQAAPPAPAGAFGGDAPASLMDSDEQTVMFTPGALDVAAALAAADAAAAAPAPAPAAPAPTPATIEPAPPPAEPAPAPAGDEEEETVMFQPGALDAELLAQVAAAAGPEVGVPAPAVEEPPAPAQPAPPGPEASDARDVELRLFMHDHALATPLHLQVLERLVKAGDMAFGRSELQLATGAALGVVSTVIDQLVQARLVRRTRAPRSRGGVGFLLATSPEKKNALSRLLKAWQAPASRAKVAAWFES